MRMQSKSSLSAVRNYANKSDNFKQALVESLESIIATVKNRFRRTKMKDEPSVIHNAATCVEIDSMIDPVCSLQDDDGLFSNIDSKTLKTHQQFPCIH